jgi:hypothetical protein
MTRTLIIYSGPTSTDRTRDKNGMYMDNMDYFLEHGVSCDASNGNATHETIEIKYVFVLTQQVADYYLAPGGKIAQKRNECANSSVEGEEYIKVILRQDRCYDMESMRIVLQDEKMDVMNSYDSLLFVNCGLVGPKCEFVDASNSLFLF